MERIGLLTTSTIPGFDGTVELLNAPIFATYIAQTHSEALKSVNQGLRECVRNAGGNMALGVGYSVNYIPDTTNFIVMGYGTAVVTDPLIFGTVTEESL
ncbi:MAG: hypothetical protein JWM07_408 [Candidatus Saccharibacteria bacterium]|nr:hypothetical protein [Candidatus Saccharibacteria bacterium]